MIETTQSAPIRVSIDKVWDYVRDIRRWAELMPGFQNCEVIDNDNSRWVLKVGVGGLVRAVKVLVHVDRWNGPEQVLFTYRLQGDPVVGGGSYVAVRKDDRTTEMTLTVRVEGSGAMAPMWEAMGAPLLPKFARAFAEQLAAGIEKANEAPAVAALSPVRPTFPAIVVGWLRKAIRPLSDSWAPKK